MKGIPRREKVCATYIRNDKRPAFVITYDTIAGLYILYSVTESDELNRIGKAKSPLDLEEKYKIKSNINGNIS